MGRPKIDAEPKVSFEATGKGLKMLVHFSWKEKGDLGQTVVTEQGVPIDALYSDVREIYQEAKKVADQTFAKKSVRHNQALKIIGALESAMKERKIPTSAY